MRTSLTHKLNALLLTSTLAVGSFMAGSVAWVHADAERQVEATRVTLAATETTPEQDTSAPTAPSAYWMRTACEQEDATNCYWNAGEVGTRSGHSFYSVRIGDKTCLIYVKRAFARKNNTCYAV